MAKCKKYMYIYIDLSQQLSCFVFKQLPTSLILLMTSACTFTNKIR